MTQESSSEKLPEVVNIDDLFGNIGKRALHDFEAGMLIRAANLLEDFEREESSQLASDIISGRFVTPPSVTTNSDDFGDKLKSIGNMVLSDFNAGLLIHFANLSEDDEGEDSSQPAVNNRRWSIEALDSSVGFRKKASSLFSLPHDADMSFLFEPDSCDPGIATTLHWIDPKATPPGSRMFGQFLEAIHTSDAVFECTSRLKDLAKLDGPDCDVNFRCFLLGGILGSAKVSNGERQEFFLPASVCLEVAKAQDKPNPLAPLVQAWWQAQPQEVTPSLRTSGRIIPAKLAQVDPVADSRAGSIFSLAAHTPDGRQALPGFETLMTGPALPLVLYDLGSGPSSRSQAAPLALRVFIEGLLAVPQEDRGNGRPVAYDVSLREFLSWFWPGRTPTPSDYWGALNEAAEALDRCRVPLIDPDTGRGQMRRIVSIGAIPRGPGALDDAVRVIVDLPRDSQNGPQLPDTLRIWGNRSAPAYRALINLAFHWHNPGQTHFPAGRKRDGSGTYWARCYDPDRYPLLSDQQLIELCYPTSHNKNRRYLRLQANRTIDRLEEAGELQRVDGKILPPPPKKGRKS